MKKYLCFAVMFVAQHTIAQIYRNVFPVTISGQVYEIVLNLVTVSSDSSADRQVRLSYYLITSEKGFATRFALSGSYAHTTVCYTFTNKYKNKKIFNQIKELSAKEPGPLTSFTKCYIKISSVDDLRLILSNTTGTEKIKIDFTKSISTLFAEESNKSTSDNKDTIPIAAQNNQAVMMTEKLMNESSSLPVNHIKIVGNIDSKKFPDNSQLLQLLKNNRDFIFKLSMNLYLDILRFNANKEEYDDQKIMNFLHTHDLWAMRYEYNPAILGRKVAACKQLLERAIEKINKGDIFYKDYKINLRSVDNLASQPISINNNSPEKDDYYSSKRIKGETDQYYTDNALNVYLTNWTSMSQPSVRKADEAYLTYLKSDNALTLRVYFIIQQLPAYSKTGVFKGVTAYGLRGILFQDCPSNYVACLENKYLNNIDDVDVRRLYSDATGYLCKMIRHTGVNGDLNPKPIYRNDFEPLGDWHQMHEYCEEGYTYLSGNVTKLPNDEALISFKWMTNYACTMQAGYELSFLNRYTDVSFSLPIANAVLIQNEPNDGYYNVTVKVPKEKLQQMLDAKVNSVSCQCLGKPGYSIAQNVQITEFPSTSIQHQLTRISAPIDADKNGVSEKLISLLKKGF